MVDSRFLIALLDAIRPGSVDMSLVATADGDEERKANAKYVLSVARKLGCAVFVLWEDIVEVRPKMIFSLVATIMGLALAPPAAA